MTPLARPRMRVWTALATFAALAADPAAADEAPVLERVEIVGSRVPRIDGETALPVRVIRRDEIERSGVQNAEELLGRVSANTGGHREAMGLGDGDTPGFSGASLRGLGAGETLVLLNGRRLANYAFTGTGTSLAFAGSSGPGVDLHAIPLAAIQRVEILKDGASAIYGSDAIAGVINFVTRDDFSGNEATLQFSLPEAGGGRRQRATLAMGRGDADRDGHNGFAVLDVQRSARLRAVDRPFASTAYQPELGLDGTVQSSWPANIQLVNPAPPPRRLVINPAAPACTELTVYKAGGCWFDYAKTLSLQSPTEQANLFTRGTLRLGGGADAYIEASLARSRIDYESSPTAAVPSSQQPDNRFVLPASSPFYPTGLGLSGDLTLAYRTVPLGPRRSEVVTDNQRLLGGLKASFGAWDVDAALAFNDTRSRESYRSGFVSSQRLRDALASGLVNPFGPSGSPGDEMLEATQVQGLAREARGRTQSADLHGNRDLARLPGGPLALAAGIEARHEELVDTLRPLLDEVAGGGSSGSKQGRRSAQAAYLELVAPVVKGFEAQAALRVDHYGDFGTATSPKLALRLQPGRDWLLRASVGRGFRAPSLPELYTQQQTGTVEFADAFVSDPVRCPVTGLPTDCDPIVPVISGGNPALRPQRSVQANLGLVLAPSALWQASLDLWSVRVHDIIASLSDDEILADIALYEGRNVIRGPAGPNDPPGLPGPIVGIVATNQNLGDWVASGADLTASLGPVSTRFGRLGVQFDGSYVRRERQSIFPGNQVDLIGRVAPRWQQVLSATLEQGGWATTLSHRYRRGYVDENPLPDDSLHHVTSYRLWDAQLSCTLQRGVQLTLGVRNLLDTDPPVTNQKAQFQLGYDPLYADPLGRTWTVALRASWR